jgi:NAD-dependent SIR2 family protein deacetylase
MAGERAKDNKTLTARCAACGKETPSVTAVGLVAIDNGRRTIMPVCPACYEKGWRPPGYAGF